MAIPTFDQSEADSRTADDRSTLCHRVT